MDRALVIGGTRFIGVHLVRELVARDVSVTVLTRGRTPPLAMPRVEHLTADRTNDSALRAALHGRTWDVCFDQIGYCGDDVARSCELLRGRVGRYALTSSAVVYGFGNADARTESEFDPSKLPMRTGDARVLGYEEGKRQAERALAASGFESWVALRIPMIVGADDPTLKLQTLIEAARAGRRTRVTSAAAITNFLPVEATARCLVFAADAQYSGPLNAGSTEALSLADLAAIITRVTGFECSLEETSNDADVARIAIPGSLVVNNARARELGFDFGVVDRWLEPLLARLAR